MEAEAGIAGETSSTARPAKLCDGCLVRDGEGTGVRTQDIQNHNLALYRLSYTLRRDALILPKPGSPNASSYFRPAFFHSRSTRCFTSGDISITPGQGRVKPSPVHFRVASMPIFEP